MTLRLQDREVGLTENTLEDIAAEVELMVAQGHGIIAHGIEGCDQRVNLQVGAARAVPSEANPVGADLK